MKFTAWLKWFLLCPMLDPISSLYLLLPFPLLHVLTILEASQGSYSDTYSLPSPCPVEVRHPVQEGRVLCTFLLISSLCSQGNQEQILRKRRVEKQSGGMDVVLA